MFANVLVGPVAAIHLHLRVLEMFLRDTPHGRKVFGNRPEVATARGVRAANQRLYNGFLAAGLIRGPGPVGHAVQLFVLGCVFVAGLEGAMSVGIKSRFVQAVPAAMAAAALLLLGCWPDRAIDR